MAMPQRDNLIDEIRKTDALLEYAVMHGEEQEAERLRTNLKRLAAMGDGEASEVDCGDCRRAGASLADD